MLPQRPSGDGRAAMADGTWYVPFGSTGFPASTPSGPGAISNGPALFDHPLATFTVTGEAHEGSRARATLRSHTGVGNRRAA